MFPQKKRLSRVMFPSALRDGLRLSSAHFTAVLPKDAKGHAVIVSKKTARLSVTRHRIKRRVTESLRTLPLPAALLLFPKPSVIHMEFCDIKEELTNLLSKISNKPL